MEIFSKTTIILFKLMEIFLRLLLLVSECYSQTWPPSVAALVVEKSSSGIPCKHKCGWMRFFSMVHQNQIVKVSPLLAAMYFQEIPQCTVFALSTT
jgi:hypothetical protein